MSKQSAQARPTALDNFMAIPLGEIDFSPTNPRKYFSEEKLDELAASIREKGVIEPVVVRPHPNGGKKRYQLVVGERRVRASLKAEQTVIPAHLRELSDEEVLDLQIIENLLREDIHPLDEAEGFNHLKKTVELDNKAIAGRVHKQESYVARRLQLVYLIDEAKEDFRADLITLGHALEICRLAPEAQHLALKACYHQDSEYKDGRWVYRANKKKPALHVNQVKAWIEQNILLNLHKAPFKMDDSRLREDKLTCHDCPQRTGFNASLFPDIKSADTCTNPACYKAKIETFVQLKRQDLTIKQEESAPQGETPKEVPLLSDRHSLQKGLNEGMLLSDDYRVIQKKTARCEFAEQAVVGHGSEVGQTRWICREPKCKDHLGRKGSSSSSSSRSTSSKPDPKKLEEFRKRKQELFDIKVAEPVRRRR